MPSLPTTSTSHTTMLDRVSSIKCDLPKKARKTDHAVSSEENTPSPMAVPESSDTEGTNTRLGSDI